MIVQQGLLTIRKLEREDDILLAKWLSDTTILAYYEGRDNPFNLEKVNKVFYKENDVETRCIIEYDGISIGYIQFYPLEKDSRIAFDYCDDTEIIYGLDQFIGESSYWGQGIGTKLIVAMRYYLIEEKQADIIVMDPQVWNERAIHCYEKCGFQKVKYLPKRELHEGKLRDCWLVEYRNR
ncbi:GNAT family N-acetyltransferase [Viridibacillus sp. YIM B01967]|uniref:GNAT family N-acetyltransferase n=1 Tax=Viridibacillus soli TaxID=2798301 RepID=A0ABS1H4I8_9BACL|nr:GNAT family N-acetyltransferase [Viridibacillus soli]MBK3494211.1 GNAT family N-acetyltransferase [Viridibacillus soli]